MRLRNEDLTHIIENSGSYEDVTIEANDFLRDKVALDLDGGDSYYVGLYKPFTDLFFEIDSGASGASFSVEYFNGSTFTTLPNVKDRTKSFSRSGFISWQFSESDKITDNWKLTEIDGQELYWVKISGSSADIISFDGVNIVFADDQDLKTEFPRIYDFKSPDLDSFINFHVAARDEIVQRYRTGGNSTSASPNSESFNIGTNLFLGKELHQVSKWDLLDIEEVNNAAKFLALAKIFFYVSENNEDKAFIRFQNYMGMFAESFKLFYLSLDKDDDGNLDTHESMALNDVRIEIV